MQKTAGGLCELRAKCERTVRFGTCVAVLVAAAVLPMLAQKDADEATSLVSFIVLREENGKPVRNAAVILHPVNLRGKQGRGGLELKTNAEGQASFDGVPLGLLRVQVIAPGFQTYGEDFDVMTAKLEVSIKMRRPKQQYSIYDDHAPAKKDAPAPEEKKPQ